MDLPTTVKELRNLARDQYHAGQITVHAEDRNSILSHKVSIVKYIGSWSKKNQLEHALKTGIFRLNPQNHTDDVPREIPPEGLPVPEAPRTEQEPAPKVDLKQEAGEQKERDKAFKEVIAQQEARHKKEMQHAVEMSKTTDRTELIQSLVQSLQVPTIDPVLIETLVNEAVKKNRLGTIKIEVGKIKTEATDLIHKQFKQVLTPIACRKNVYLVGQAGSGKTHIAGQVAKALELPFKSMSLDRYTGLEELAGRNSPLDDTHFQGFLREPYELGGVVLLDEIDNAGDSLPPALNALIENTEYTFLDGETIEKHPDFIVIVTANTYGKGGDLNYVGRNRLDGAFLSRFVFIDLEIDEELELKFSPMEDWTKYIQAVRKAVIEQHHPYIISPRQSRDLGACISSGWTWKDAQNSLFAGVDTGTRKKVENRANELLKK